jgi:hypothetical protein
MKFSLLSKFGIVVKKVSWTFIYFLGLVLLLALSGAHGTSAQRAENRVGLVVQFGDGTVRSYCIAFEGESISGMDLLVRSGLEVVAEGYGAMGGQVCKIGAEGCDYPGELCACKSYGPGGVYWTYHHLRAGVWKTSAVGASSYRVRNGEVDGWAWSSGKGPRVLTFEQICGVSQPAPTDTPKAPPPTSTPRPQPTRTARPPSATPSPSQRPQPTATHKPHTVTPEPPKPSNTAITIATDAATPTRRPSTPASTPTPPRVQPTNTSQIQIARPSATKTAIKQATATRRTVSTNSPNPTTAPISTATFVVTPSEQPSSATPTSVPIQPTSTQTATPQAETSTPTSIVTETSTPVQTNTPSALPATPATSIPSATTGAQSPPVDTARSVSIAIGATIVAGLLVWGGVKLASRRVATGNRGGGRRVG